MVLAAADAVPLHVAVGVVVGDVIQMAVQPEKRNMHGLV